METTLFWWGWGNEGVFLLPPGNPCELGVTIATPPSKLTSHRCSDAGGSRVDYVTLASLFFSETGSTQKATPDSCLKHSGENFSLTAAKFFTWDKNATQENPEAEKHSERMNITVPTTLIPLFSVLQSAWPNENILTDVNREILRESLHIRNIRWCK